MPRRLSVTILLASVLALLCASAAVAAPDDRARERRERVVVVLRDRVDAKAAATDAERRLGARVSRVYRHALRGYAALVPRGRLQQLRDDPRVAYVEPDRIHRTQEQATPTGVRRVFADKNSKVGIDSSDDQRVDVDVAVIDTGIDLDHPDLNVVAQSVHCRTEVVWWWQNTVCDGNGDDDNGHGTHVAGIIGAIDNGIGVVGVAPGARLWAVKVLDASGSGYTSAIIAGIDWVTARADQIEVANMSLSGSGYSHAEYDAIQNAVNKGVAFAVAAGNSSDDASNYSPAAFDNVLTVSAIADGDGAPGGDVAPGCWKTQEDDALASFSNWGPAVDIAAPGVCIDSTVPGGYGRSSGTSMASPHVVGALALLASVNKHADAEDVSNLYAEVTSGGNSNWTDTANDGTREPLLDVATFDAATIPGTGGGSAPEPNEPPTASFTSICKDLDCTFESTSIDVDGTVASYAWTFGDGATASGKAVAHTYGAAGMYTVTLTVTDDDKESSSAEQRVTVEAPPSDGIALTAEPDQEGRRYYAHLRWSGASSNTVDIYRDGRLRTTTANDGTHADYAGRRNRSRTYRVCEAGTATCSEDVTVNF